MNTLAPSAFADALRTIDDGIAVSLDGDDVKITATLSAQRGYARISTEWQRRELTPEFLVEVACQLGQIAASGVLPRNWHYVAHAAPGAQRASACSVSNDAGRYCYAHRQPADRCEIEPDGDSL